MITGFSFLQPLCLISLLLILQTDGVAVFIYKVKSFAIKKDINLLYGIDYQEKGEEDNISTIR